MRLERVSLTDAAAMGAWDRFVEAHAHATPCHLSCWLGAIHSAYSYEPLLYFVRNGVGELCGIFPLFRISSRFTGKRIVSLPFSDYGGPLLSDATDEAEVVDFVRLTYTDSGELQTGIRRSISGAVRRRTPGSSGTKKCGAWNLSIYPIIITRRSKELLQQRRASLVFAS